MSPQFKKKILPSQSTRDFMSGQQRDIIWNQPIFRPPLLQNPRVIFDPLPFTAQRRYIIRRPAAGC